MFDIARTFFNKFKKIHVYNGRVFKKKLGASGTLKIDDGIIIGDGFDSYRNKIKFVSTMN